MDFKDICSIMYTSGSTGNPKGVMLSVQNFSINVEDLKDDFPYRPAENYLSILPFAHIFGLVCDGIIPLVLGMHEVILGLPPVPANIHEAMNELHPHIFFAVPLILTKFIEYSIGKDIHSEEGKARLADYENNRDYCDMLRDKMIQALGGQIEEFVTGGAAIPSDLELLLTEKLRLPFVTGYGMTETSPLISIAPLGEYKLKSCGKVSRLCLDLKIDSPDPENIPGEVLVKGPGVFTGYYKNPAATAAVFTEDGWFRTGDIGTVDSDRTVFLVGRCKNMLLGTNGQNIFPEEVEVILNTLPYVAESIIVSRGSKRVALIVRNADRLAADNIGGEEIHAIIGANLKRFHSQIPAYSAISGYELKDQPFAKTPKGSIRRFMY
ncbi:MAG: AMP-binding protein [Bacteroidales bacterium]|nr:AMP-binding protein [Bacteroidales bacterium]